MSPNSTKSVNQASDFSRSVRLELQHHTGLWIVRLQRKCGSWYVCCCAAVLLVLFAVSISLPFKQLLLIFRRAQVRDLVLGGDSSLINGSVKPGTTALRRTYAP